MAPILTWKLEAGRLFLSGRIDENADLSRHTNELLAQATELDLSGLTRINSIGVREWMDFAAGFTGRSVRLLRCAPVFVDQLNAIANFSGGAEVVSVLSAYECEVDGEVTLVEVQTQEARLGQRPSPPACPRCGASMVAAADDALFFRFLKYAR